MPGAFPAATPTLSGDLLTVSRFLQNPANIARRLRTFQDLRFVSDQLLTGRYRVSGGAIVYEQSESQVTDRPVDKVNPGAVYPYANVAQAIAALAAVAKWGQKIFMSDEEILRNVYAGSEIDRNLRKVVNSIIKQVDAITMSAIISAVTQTIPVTAAWDAATPVFLRDVLKAKAVVAKLNMGYNPDTLALNDTQFAYLMSDDKFTNAIRREDTSNPVYTGQVDRVAGLAIVVSPAITDPIVLDSNQLGGMADEQGGSPGYAVSDMAVEVKSIRLDGRDGWDMQGRRKTVPVVQEPGSAIRITGTNLTT
jgi:hypothetical protein